MWFLATVFLCRSCSWGRTPFRACKTCQLGHRSCAEGMKNRTPGARGHGACYWLRCSGLECGKRPRNRQCGVPPCLHHGTRPVQAVELEQGKRVTWLSNELSGGARVGWGDDHRAVESVAGPTPRGTGDA
jgi:hypothetical protein